MQIMATTVVVLGCGLLLGCFGPGQQGPGLVAPPRAPIYDGQPLSGVLRIEGHAATTVFVDGRADDPESDATVTRHEVGGVVRLRLGQTTDLGFEYDVGWQAHDTTLAGEPSDEVGLPDASVRVMALALRSSWEIDGPLRFAWSASIGEVSCPTADGRRRETQVRIGWGPSYRRGALTGFGHLSVATESDLPRPFTPAPGENGKGRKTNGAAATLSVGASLAVLKRIHLLGEAAYGVGIYASYGPMVAVGLGLDI